MNAFTNFISALREATRARPDIDKLTRLVESGVITPLEARQVLGLDEKEPLTPHE